MLFSVYFVQDEHRVEAIKTFSVNRRFKWVEQGMLLASWSYQLIEELEKNSIKEVKDKFSDFTIGKRHKGFRRSINIGDVIVVQNNQAFVFTPLGWLLIPNVLWEKAKKV